MAALTGLQEGTDEGQIKVGLMEEERLLMISAQQEGPCPAGVALCSVSLTAQQLRDQRRVVSQLCPQLCVLLCTALCLLFSLFAHLHPVPLEDRIVSSLPCPRSWFREWTSESRGDGRGEESGELCSPIP